MFFSEIKDNKQVHFFLLWYFITEIGYLNFKSNILNIASQNMVSYCIGKSWPIHTPRGNSFNKNACLATLSLDLTGDFFLQLIFEASLSVD